VATVATVATVAALTGGYSRDNYGAVPNMSETFWPPNPNELDMA
jgi:hypothetical protein